MRIDGIYLPRWLVDFKAVSATWHRGDIVPFQKHEPIPLDPPKVLNLKPKA